MARSTLLIRFSRMDPKQQITSKKIFQKLSDIKKLLADRKSPPVSPKQEQYIAKEKEKKKEEKKERYKDVPWYDDFKKFSKQDTVLGMEKEIRNYLSLVLEYACVLPELYLRILPLQVTLANCLLMELCIKSMENIKETSFCEVFSPDVNNIKFLEAEKIVKELFLVNPMHLKCCILFIRIQIYKARSMYKNGDKDGAENILKKCAANLLSLLKPKILFFVPMQ